MAKQILTKLLDDLDGGEADETVVFAIDGIAYEIDLSAKNASRLREFMSPFQEAGTRLGRSSHGNSAQIRSFREKAAPQNTAMNRELNQRIRTWAAANGYDLAERGRIPQHIVDAYGSNTPHPTKVAADQAKRLEDELAANSNGAKKTAEAPRQRATPAKRTAAAKA